MSKDKPSTQPVDPSSKAAHEHDDDVIVAPKGSNRTRFLMTALLVVLVLTTFTVSGEVVDVLTGRNRAKSAYMTWKRSDGTVETIKQSDFLLAKQDLARVESILSGGRTSRERDDTRIARHILLNELAQEAGVEITDAELADRILKSFGSADTYTKVLDHYRTTALEFEATLRALLRVERYETLLSEAAAIPDPKAVLEKWKENNKEYSLQTIELPTAGFADEAKAACPPGDDLRTWFEGLSDAEKNLYRTHTEAKTAAEFAWFVFEPQTNTEKLLAKYPRPATEKAEDVAKTWYETNKDLLFRKPGLPPGKVPAAEDYLSFEEVKDRAQTQGTVDQSVMDWLNDMKAREEKGETISLPSEASTLGFGYRREEAAHTRAEWKAAAMAWSGQGALAAMFAPTSQVGKLLPDVIVDPKGIFVGRLIERQDSRTPAFEEFQDKARDGWIERKKGELAIAKLEAFRAKLPTQADPKNAANEIAVEPDDAKFQAAASEAGLEVKTQDWFDANSPLKAGQATPFVLFQRQTAKFLGGVVGAVSKPSLSTDKSAAWVARMVATREPDASKMTPQDYQSAKQLAVYEARSQFFQSTFGSDEFLKQHYGLELESWRREEAEKGAADKGATEKAPGKESPDKGAAEKDTAKN